jgi:hypothetical protein
MLTLELAAVVVVLAEVILWVCDDMGADDMGADDLGGDLGGDEPEEPAAETPAADEPEGNLLAVPGKRDDDVVKMAKKGAKGKVFTTTNKSKGKWYEPRDDQSGKRALARSMKSMGSMRGITGVPHGYKDMNRLSRGVSEEQQSNYDVQEEQILEHNNEIKKLLTELETKNNVKQD